MTALRVTGAALLLLTITAAVLLLRHRRRYLVVGWFWYLGTLVPMIGLVQTGMMAMADRFTYIPLIGIFVMFVWGITPWVRPVGLRMVGTVCLLGALFPVTLGQVRYWHDSVALFRRAVKVNPEDPFVHGSLTLALALEGKRGNLQEVMRSYRETLRLKMQDPFQRILLGYTLAQQGKTREAIEQYQAALQLEPDYPDALNGLAQIYATHPEPEFRSAALAVQLAEKACTKTSYKTPLFLDTLAAAYAEAGRFEDAVRVATQAAQLARESSDVGRAREIETRLKLYRAGKPYREPPAGE